EGAPGLPVKHNPREARWRAPHNPTRRAPPRGSAGHRRDHSHPNIFRIGASSHGSLRIRGTMDSQSKSTENPQLDHIRFIESGKCSRSRSTTAEFRLPLLWGLFQHNPPRPEIATALKYRGSPHTRQQLIRFLRLKAFASD